MSDLYWGWVSVTSRCHTWLKKRPVEAKELSNDEKAQIVPSRSILRCKILDRENDHTYLEMLYGLGDWWIDDNHWDGLNSEPRVKPYAVNSDLIFLKDFPYFYQDPEKVGDSHIFTFAMCLKYLKTPGINGVMEYSEALNKYGNSIQREAHVQALADFGRKATFTYSADPDDIQAVALARLYGGATPRNTFAARTTASALGNLYNRYSARAALQPEGSVAAAPSGFLNYLSTMNPTRWGAFA